MKKAAEILARVLDEKNRELGRTYSSVFGSWAQTVGPSLAEHSRIYEISNQYLFVEVDHPGWMQLLLMKKAQILRAMSRMAPQMGIRDLRVKVNLSYAGADTHEETPVDCEQSDGTENSEHLEDIDRVLSSVPQEELKHRLKRLFLKSLEKENSG